MNEYWQHHRQINRLFNAPRYRYLKYSALVIIGAVIAVQIAMIIWIDDISNKARLVIQGCVSIGVAIFVLLVTIISYRVFTDYSMSKYRKRDGNK
jgi:nitrogen fixation/metabolism regulation signal transduction histidine kinase